MLEAFLILAGFPCTGKVKDGFKKSGPQPCPPASETVTIKLNMRAIKKKVNPLPRIDVYG